MKRSKYPENWEWLSKQVRKRNHGRCELCNAPDGTTVLRPKKEYEGNFTWPWYKNEYNFAEPESDEIRKVKIVLTVHHIDGDKMNSSERNLISLCQKCHLRLDIEKHMRNRKANRGKE